MIDDGCVFEGASFRAGNPAFQGMFPIGKTAGYSKNDGESVKFFIFAFELEEWLRFFKF